MKSYRYSAQAEADLDEITEYFAARSPDAGLKFLDALETRCRILANFPRTGRQRNEFGPGVRSIVVRNYVVYFREESEGITVLRVLHGARDVAAEMFDE